MASLSTIYNARELEAHWQGVWQAHEAFAPRGSGTPFYVLEMFPYPSGDLHMGHVRNYTLGDVFARFARMQGRQVLHPMGWDSLGLPAENQAIREKVAPQVRTPKNIARMREQMQQLGLAYDWSREIATHQASYYRWNQWFFLKFLEKGWIFRRSAQVNWCPGCQTILANEQVREDNTCWRGHEGVTQRSVPEWAFRITAYADDLLTGLQQLSAWPERIVTQQRNWLGKSVGARLRFKVVGSDIPIEVFTTRIDTVYGCTYLVLAPEHTLVGPLTTAAQQPQVEAFAERMRQLDPIQRTAEGGKKEGVFTGAYAINPFTGTAVPIWVANFVLANYGTGAVMSVPAHDARDFEFAQIYELPQVPVVTPLPPASSADSPGPVPSAQTEGPYVLDGLLQNSGPFSGLTSAAAREPMVAHACAHDFGAAAVNWHLRDWGFSRQRYWGTPIPIVYCDKDGVVPVPEKDLPVTLPDFDDVQLTGQGGAPLGKLPSFYETACPKCGGPAKREVETMDTFVDSAWYFARFVSPHHTDAPFDRAEVDRWLPVDVYVGGPEHAVMHLLYFRFWTKAMRDLGLVHVDEPVRRLITQGMVNALSFRCPTHGYVAASDMRHKAPAEQICPTCDKPLIVASEKMSKSKYNGVDPLELIARYGADTARMYTLFAAPPEKDLEWNPEGVEGLHRFASRIWRLLSAQAAKIKGIGASRSMQGLEGAAVEVRRAVHRTLAKVTDEMQGRNHFNTALAAMMELVNVFHAYEVHEAHCQLAEPVVCEALQVLAQMLSPFAPHLAETLWQECGGTGLVMHSTWPLVDSAALVQETMTIAVQVNGKLRGQVQTATGANSVDVLAAAREDENVQRHLVGKHITKEIYVPGRLINFVVRDA